MENVFLVHKKTGKMYPLSLEKENIIERGGGDKDVPGWILIPDPTVSRLHAKIYIQDNQFVLENLSARNGTCCNDCKIDSPVVLKHGDKVTVGNNELFFYENFIAGETQEILVDPKGIEEKAGKFPGMYLHGLYAGIILILALSWMFLLSPSTSESRKISAQTDAQTIVEKDVKAIKEEEISQKKVPENAAPENAIKQNDSGRVASENKISTEQNISSLPKSEEKPAKIVYPIQGEGYIYARKETSILVPWETKIAKVMVEKGTIVEKGQILATLDLSRLKKDIGIYEMELQIAKKELQLLESQISTAEKKFKETASLYSRGLQSQNLYEKEKEDITTMKKRMEASAQKQKLAQLHLSQAQEKVLQDKIQAPSKGMITEVVCKTGEIFQANMALFQFALSEDIFARLEFPDSYSEAIHEKQRVFLSLSENFETKYKALVRKVFPDPKKLQIFIDIAFLNPDSSIVPGKKVYAQFLQKK